MRVCIVYDCLFPYTIGGAERWYRSLAEALAREGHDVTYLTMRRWEASSAPAVAGVRVVAVTGPHDLYTASGRRAIGPPVAFGAGVFAHLLRHGGSYDVVHTASFPYFSALAAGALRRPSGYELVVDWHEVWTGAYWHEYLGRMGGAVGATVQLRCLRLRQHALCFSAGVERRLHAAGVRDVTRLAGLRELPPAQEPAPAGPAIVYAGRHIPEKQVPALVPAFLAARERIPGLRCEIYGDGPDRPAVLQAIAEQGLAGEVSAPGFVEEGVLDEAIARALCFVLPSRREGYGLVVVEAAARGTPSVVVAGEDNAALELVEEGVNGAVAASVAPEDLADAIERVQRGGPELRASTARWYRENADRFSLERSLEIVARLYASLR